MKKRLQALLLALCLTLGTIGAGCGGRQDNNAAGTETAAATETEKTASVEDSAMAKANTAPIMKCFYIAFMTVMEMESEISRD